MDELKTNLSEAIEGCFAATQDDSLREEQKEPGEVVTL
jgi:predicted RNase H-like HicB family nuclease